MNKTYVIKYTAQAACIIAALTHCAGTLCAGFGDTVGKFLVNSGNVFLKPEQASIPTPVITSNDFYSTPFAYIGNTVNYLSQNPKQVLTGSATVLIIIGAYKTLSALSSACDSFKGFFGFKSTAKEVKKISAKLNNQQDDIDSLTVKVDTLTEEISQIKAKQVESESTLGKIFGMIQGLFPRVEKLENSNQKIDTRLNNLENSTNNIQNDLEMLKNINLNIQTAPSNANANV